MIFIKVKRVKALDDGHVKWPILNGDDAFHFVADSMNRLLQNVSFLAFIFDFGLGRPCFYKAKKHANITA